MPSPKRLALALLLLGSVAACGTTVPLQDTAGTAQAGLPAATSTDPAAGLAAPDTTNGTGLDSAPTASGGSASAAADAAGAARAVGSAATAGPAGSAAPGTAGQPNPGQAASHTTGKSTRSAAPGSKKTAAPVKTATVTKSAAAGSAASTTAPLLIGLTYQDTGAALSAIGASSSGLSAKSAAEAMVNGFNNVGGVDGRKLQMVEYGLDDTSSNYSTDAQAACSMFTEDNHVALVLDTGFGTDAGFRDCLQKAGVLDITSGDEGDKAAANQDPIHVNSSQSNHDRAYSAVLQGLVGDGYVTKTNQLGIVVENCSEDTGPYTQTIVPLIAKLGLKSPVMQQINCTAGFASAGADASSLSSAVLAFRGAGVDRVMFVSGYESIVAELFASSANSQGYTPGYLLSSTAAAEQLRGDIPSAQWPGMHGVGNFPTLDVDGATPTAVENRCLKIAAAAGVTPSGYVDYSVLYPACGPFLLLEAALLKTNGDSSAQALVGAIDGLGTSFASPGVLGNSTSISGSVHDAPNMAQVFSYDATCTCMRYLGSPFPIPS